MGLGTCEGDEFPRRLCDPLPPVILFYQPTNGNIKQQSQGVGGHRVFVGIRPPLQQGGVRMGLGTCKHYVKGVVPTLLL